MRYQFLLILVLLIVSCKSPSELLEEGKYEPAFRNAVNEVKKRKNVDQNIKVIETAADIKVSEALLYSKIKTESENVKDWIDTQTKVYILLEELGKANLLIEGAISEPYDLLCNNKKEIDYQIVEYYYDEGQDHLDQFYYHGNKVDARNAYYSFKNCEKYKGHKFFLNLPDDIQDAYQNGIVYYVSNYDNIGNKLFLQHLPNGADFLPDCDIYIDHGFVSYVESESSSSKSYTKEVQKGQEAVKDTSGNVTYKPIHETISATVTTTTVTITAHVTTYLKSKDVTGQCAFKSRQFTTQVSDTYEEVSVEGDKDALNHHISTNSGEPAFFSSGLKTKVLRLAERNIGF